MSGPYVAFRVNRASKTILTETVGFEPDPLAAFDASFSNPLEWLIVCDSADKVVIRALEDGKRTLKVIAIAELRGMTLVRRRQIDPTLPSMGHWAWLEEVVYPTRARGYDGGKPDAFDRANLATTPSEPESTPRSKKPTLPGLPSQIEARPNRPPTWPPPIPAADAPLWSPPAAEKAQPPRNKYIELLFDHASVRVIEGTVRYAPDHAVRPVGFYQHKLVCDPQGNVAIFATPDPERDMVRLATCTWKDSGLCERKQAGGEPDVFQWMALEDALRGELSRAP